MRRISSWMSFTVPQARYSPVHAEDSRLDSADQRNRGDQQNVEQQRDRDAGPGGQPRFVHDARDVDRDGHEDEAGEGGRRAGFGHEEVVPAIDEVRCFGIHLVDSYR